MVKLAVDAMGGDHAPREIVRGAVAALQAQKDLELLLVGRRVPVEEALAGLSFPGGRLEIIQADEVIRGDDNPALAVRRKKNSSLVVALDLVKTGRADAILSAGNTGALLAGALLHLGRLSGVTRPALLTVIPGFNRKPFVLLDAGANMDARPGQLVQYAFMGRIYAQKMLGIPSPRVALLNVGAETNKGNSMVKKAFPLLQEYISGFCGNVEGTDVYFDAADVVVCDGFVGNVLLKLTEGFIRGFSSRLKEELKLASCGEAGSALPGAAFEQMHERLVGGTGAGGAPLVGVKGLCIKCHGASRARAVEQAVLQQAHPFVRLRLDDLFQKALRDMPRC
ncbi:MAG: phosphate acyltransferase PlsX [Firmicutes bacterium]|nr:phosphate acyltransferase PlsX [Bacillota bacterium]